MIHDGCVTYVPGQTCYLCPRPYALSYLCPSFLPLRGSPLRYAAGFSTVHTDAQIGPPMLNVAAARAFFTCSAGGTLPSSCQAAQPTIATPVAPIGWPFAMRPPEVLMPHSPSTLALPSTQ